MRVEVLGLYAVVSDRGGRFDWPIGHEVEVRVTRMDPDEWRIFVTENATPSAQLTLL